MDSEDRELADLIKSFKDRQACSDVQAEPKAPSKLSFNGKLDKLKASIDNATCDGPTDAEIQRDELAKERNRQLSRFLVSRGERYRGCSFASYLTETESQRAAVDTLSAVAQLENLPNVILFGPRGTGKDHLMVAAIRTAFGGPLSSVYWTTGMDLFGDIRDRMESAETERSFVERLGSTGLLAISDPIPISGGFTEHQANMLYRIIDRRYSCNRPTWVTINVSSGAEFDQKLGAATADRIRDGALVIECNWRSHRKTRS
jgi:DNA replication protein DnaC